jgi:hypothetical protein
MTTIRIDIDPDLAQVYNSTSADNRRKVQLLVSMLMREIAREEKPSLEQIMDQISDNAQERGLTPEILETLLNDGN